MLSDVPLSEQLDGASFCRVQSFRCTGLINIYYFLLNFSDEESSPKKEHMSTPGKNAFYSTCHVCQDKIKILHWGHDINGHKGYTVSEEANHSHHDDKVKDLQLLPKTVVDMTDVKDIQHIIST